MFWVVEILWDGMVDNVCPLDTRVLKGLIVKISAGILLKNTCVNGSQIKAFGAPLELMVMLSSKIDKPVSGAGLFFIR